MSRAAAWPAIGASGPTGTAGYCGITDPMKDAGCSASSAKGLGCWQHVARRRSCFAYCYRCAACHFVSFSARFSDCSWFRNCPQLHVANSKSHRSYRVREDNGTLLPWHLRAAATDQTLALGRNDWFERPRRVFFHEQSATLQYALSRRPDFRGQTCLYGDGLMEQQGRLVVEADGERGAAACRPSVLAQWSRAMRWHLHPSLALTKRRRDGGRRRWSTCAVVGSSPSLLSPGGQGARIDAAQAVIRVNRAPTAGYERHVGSRTTLRVWGSAPYPDEELGWLNASEAVAIYCPPTAWLSRCFRSIPLQVRRDPGLLMISASFT
jgi:hypothetical protein